MTDAPLPAPDTTAPEATPDTPPDPFTPIENQNSITINPPISDRRLAANRANALKSTGPRTPEGKFNTSLNALTHGLRSRINSTTLVSRSEIDEYSNFLDDLRQTLDPHNTVEDLLVERIALLAWKLRRTVAAQAQFLDLSHQRECALIEQQNEKKLKAHETQLSYASRAERKIMDPPDIKPIPSSPPAPELFLRLIENSGTSLRTLHHYESATERALYRALDKYHRLRNAEASQAHHHFHYHRHQVENQNSKIESPTAPPPPSTILDDQTHRTVPI